MRIKLFENFKHKPFILDSFDEAVGKLEGKDGIVLSGVKGDITHIESIINEIPHTESYILITKKEGPSENWESAVFLIGAGKTLTMSSGTKNYPNFRKLYNAMTIEEYFEGEDEWIDPAGGRHRGDEVDGASMYEDNTIDNGDNIKSFKKKLNDLTDKKISLIDKEITLLKKKELKTTYPRDAIVDGIKQESFYTTYNLKSKLKDQLEELDDLRFSLLKNKFKD